MELWALAVTDCGMGCMLCMQPAVWYTAGWRSHRRTPACVAQACLLVTARRGAAAGRLLRSLRPCGSWDAP